jgi:DNA-binding MarR family transcriptional regulator
MNTANIIRALESKNVSQRPKHPPDTRAKTSRLTPGAIAVLAQAGQSMETFDKQFLLSFTQFLWLLRA